MSRNFKSNDSDTWKAIVSDIHDLQISTDDIQFEQAAELLREHWRTKYPGNASVDKFSTMMSISHPVSLIVLLVPIDVLFALVASHYGDCGGTGKMPPPHKRSGNVSIHGATPPWRYVFAEGSVACANGEKIRGRVELWNDHIEQGDKYETATYGACGPIGAITMGYFEVDGFMRDPGDAGATPEPYLLFKVECEGADTLEFKRCLKCPEKWEPSETAGWEMAETGLKIMLPNKKPADVASWVDGRWVAGTITCRSC